MAARFNEPLFVISVAARLVEMHPQTLRKYEKEGLIEPSRTSGNLRLYSDRDIERLRQVKYLVEQRGLNLAGVQLVLELTRKLRSLREQTDALYQDAARTGSQRRAGDSYALLRDELDGVLRMLGFVEEPQRDDRRDGRPILQ
ncbi:MAG TPA: MerR family transcriptional regulator [Thermomicrobiales bacterium]|jgi:MerR family transcriptional regulator/heat shock protein HspR